MHGGCRRLCANWPERLRGSGCRRLRCAARVTQEVCNGVDDDCRDDVDEGFAPLSCGVGACAVTPPSCVGGTLAMCTPGPPGVETCNRIDDDCNGIVDDGAGCDIAEISAG